MDESAQLVREIQEIVSGRIDLKQEPSDIEIEELITSVVFEKSKEGYLSLGQKQELVKLTFNAMRRLGVLQPLVDDPRITEIMVNGPGHIFIEKEGKLMELPLKLESREKLEDMIQSIVAKVNRSVNEASPLVDARLADGSRVSVVLPPVALNGPILTIRKFPQIPLSMAQLVAMEALSQEAADFLNNLVKARYNIFICGGTGSGKTTLLNLLSNFIPAEERLITIEDSAELQINGIKNLVRMEARNANSEGKGRVTIRDLIRMSLRMRPERIVVGEVRGEEALDMLQAMNTGHDGSLSTGHGNSTADMLRRLETMVLLGAALPLEAIRQQIASAIEIVIHLTRLRDKSRRVMEISEIAGYQANEILLNPLFVFEEYGETEEGRVLGKLIRTNNPLLNLRKFKLAGIPVIAEKEEGRPGRI